jgi:hypothetical protein
VEFGRKRASFELDPPAERWAEKIRNPKTLLDKLGVEPDQRVSVIGVADEEIRVLLRERGIHFGEDPQPESDLILFGGSRWKRRNGSVGKRR